MEYSIRPEEHELREARKLIEKIMEKARHMLPKEKNVEFRLGWEGRDDVVEEQRGSHGQTFSSEVITISFNSGHAEWKNSIRQVTAHEFAHSYFYEVNEGQSSFIWEWILEEAMSQNFAEKVFPEIEAIQRTAVNKEKFDEKWPETREMLGEEMDYRHEVFFGGENFPRWFGYSLAYRLGRKLMEKHELEEFPELEKSHVIEAGDRVFGGKE